MAAFLDTNVILRHLLQDHPDHSPRATAYIGRVERGEVEVHLAETVVFEAVFLLERRHRRPKAQIRDELLEFLELPGVVLPGKSRLRGVFDLYVDLNISFADAYHVVQARRVGINEIVSFDHHYDRVPGIVRVEP